MDIFIQPSRYLKAIALDIKRDLQHFDKQNTCKNGCDIIEKEFCSY
jgi:hypothetical protein